MVNFKFVLVLILLLNFGIGIYIFRWGPQHWSNWKNRKRCLWALRSWYRWCWCYDGNFHKIIRVMWRLYCRIQGWIYFYCTFKFYVWNMKNVQLWTNLQLLKLWTWLWGSPHFMSINGEGWGWKVPLQISGCTPYGHDLMSMTIWLRALNFKGFRSAYVTTKLSVPRMVMVIWLCPCGPIHWFRGGIFQYHPTTQ